MKVGAKMQVLFIMIGILATAPIWAQWCPKPDWIRQFGCYYGVRGSSFAVDAEGTFVTGAVSCALPYQSMHNTRGGSDAFIRKYDFEGNELWTRQFGTNEGTSGECLASASGGVYVVGSVSGILSSQSFGNGDCFVRKYDPQGNELWTRQFGTRDSDYALTVTSFEESVYVGWYISPWYVPAAPGVGDCHLEKYDSEGNFVWTRQFGSSYWDTIEALASDASGVYVTYLGGDSYGSYGTYVTKLDHNGNQLWLKGFSSPFNDVVCDLAVDSSGVYVVGSVDGALPGQTYGGGMNDAFIRKYDLNGNALWTREFGGTGRETALKVTSSGLGDGTIYVAVSEPGKNPSTIYASDVDIVVRKFDPDGNEIWNYTVATDQFDSAGGLGANETGIYVTGCTWGVFPGQTSEGPFGVNPDVYVYKFHESHCPPVAEAGGPYVVAEGTPVVFDGTGSGSPGGEAVSYEWDLDGDGIYENSAGPAPIMNYPDNMALTIGLSVTNGYGLSATDTAGLTVFNVAPFMGNMTTPLEPVSVNVPINLSASFSDPGIFDTHTAIWTWGDGTTSDGAVAETNGSGSVSGTHSYLSAGVYAVSLTITDKDGGAVQATSPMIVVYDPQGGFVTGGGWFESPPGAYGPNPGLSGRANFGFVSKYQKGASVPTGQTEFQFQVGDLNFHSESYDWLVIAGARAMYKGAGTINNEGDYTFMIVAIDGIVPGGHGVDRFRIKIRDRATGVVLYDNEAGAAEEAIPNTAIKGGNIVIHMQ